MAEQLLRGDEVIAMLKASGAPNRVVEAFRKQADFVFSKKPEDRIDNVAREHLRRDVAPRRRRVDGE